MGPWERIQRHKIAQWTLAYAAAAYTLLHATEMVSDALSWPHLIVRALTLTLLLVLPVVVVLAWYHGHKAQLQDGTAAQIVAALKTSLHAQLAPAVAVGPPTEDPEAYRLYLQARALSEQSVTSSRLRCSCSIKRRRGTRASRAHSPQRR